MTDLAALELSCHCGSVRVETNKTPDYINDCNCTFCSKSGAMWGYFHPSEVRIEGDTSAYSRADKDDPGALLQFCAACGSTTHFTLTESAQAMHGNIVAGVNMRLLSETELAGVEVRYPDALNWSGEGAVPYYCKTRVIGADETVG